MAEVLQMAKPEANSSGSKRTANINTNEQYSTEARTAEITKISEVLEKDGIQHQIGECPDGPFIKVNDNLFLMNEFFYNSAIKQKEWKIRFLVDGKYTAHYKASNLDKILAKTKALLA